MAITDLFQNFASGFRAPENPQEIDPQTGMSLGDTHDAKMQSLRNMSSLFLAAGQSMSGADRAKILMQMGDATDPTKRLYTMAQARLMNQNVSDAMEKRQRREQALQALGSYNLEGLSERERAVYGAYIQAGDPDGALEFLTKVSDNNSQLMPLSDGTGVSKGIGLANRTDFNKNHAPRLQSLSQTVSMGMEALNAIDGGLFSGSLGDAQLAGAKLLRMAGYNDPEMVNKILNSENLQAATMDAVLQRMSQLGGNDSNEELRRMQASLAGGTLEKETLRANMKRILKTAIEQGVISNEQGRRLMTNGQTEYNMPVKFDPSLIWDENYRTIYESITGGEAAQPNPPASSGNGPKRYKFNIETGELE